MQLQKAGTRLLAILGVAVMGFCAKSISAQTPGEAVFKTKCAVCHGADGKGETPVAKANKQRDLGSAEVQKQSDGELSAIIGSGKGKMPAYGKSLKAEQIKELVAYIRTLKR
ncbi:MAG TPA: c-type cytochrome [Candidatus Acidoferrum sp.]|jgi:cytochrome c6